MKERNRVCERVEWEEVMENQEFMLYVMVLLFTLLAMPRRKFDGPSEICVYGVCH
jgi:hypothetical protein